MRITPRITSGVLFAFLMGWLWISSGAYAAVKPPASFPHYDRPVTIWVPPYAVSNSFVQLKQVWKGSGAQHAITHLALQFWQPTHAGGVRLVDHSQVNADSIQSLRDWAHSHGIRVMLCVYNADRKGAWDWGLARSAFATNRAVFIQNLNNEVNRLALDGVDVDLEGAGSLNGDKPEFIAFIRQLSTVLHKQSRHLTVDTFAYVWHAPNQTWWADLFPYVDGIASMGYEEIGAGGREWRSYKAQRRAAGRHAARLQLGVPSHQNRWQNGTMLDHLRWIEKDRRVGVAIWDAQLRAESWCQAEAWETLRRIRGPQGKKSKPAAAKRRAK